MTSLTSAVVLLNRDSVLLQLRDNLPNIDYPDTWSIPGGTVEAGETSKQAALRELREETGYQAKTCKFLTKLKYFSENKQKTLFAYIVLFIPGQPICCLEGQEMKWFSLKEIESVKMPPVIRKVFKILQKHLKKCDHLI